MSDFPVKLKIIILEIKIFKSLELMLKILIFLKNLRELFMNDEHPYIHFYN